MLAVATDSKGHVFGIPFSPYAMSISYNRDDFTKAGLDPNKPPTTWDEVETDAKAISAVLPGVAGYMQMTERQHGWLGITSAAYTRGGRLETTAPNGKVTVDADIPAVKESLAYLSKIRWTDNSAGSNFILDWNGINAAFGPARSRCTSVDPTCSPRSCSTTHVDPSNYGVTTIPLEWWNAGVLSGGTLAAAT